MPPRRTLLLGTVLALALSAPPAHADLRAGAGKPPAQLKAGDPLPVTVTTRNAGKRRAPASRTRIRLGKVRIGTVRVPGLKPGRRHTATARLRVPVHGGVAGRSRLRVCATRCRTAGRTTVVVTVDDVIAAAKPDAQRALVYRAIAAAGERAGLPKRYRGAAPTDEDAVAQAVAAYPSLPASLRRALAPALIPPAAKRGRARSTRAAAGTACEAEAGTVPDTAKWDRRVAPRSKVTFWWPKGNKARAADARTLAVEMDARIWPKLTGHMKVTPPSDGAMRCAHGTSGGLDVYLTGQISPLPLDLGGVAAINSPYRCTNGADPSFIRLYVRTKEVLAHEFFHVLQRAYADRSGCGRPDWLDEGTADWARQYVYPGALKNLGFASQGSRPFLSQAYSGWSFWYSVARGAGEDAIRQVYANLARQDRVPAADAAIGTFTARWPEFARNAWNQVPVDPSFRSPDWVGLADAPSDARSAVGLGGAKRRVYPFVGASLEPLTRDYTGFSFPDAKNRSIRLVGLPADPGYKLLGLMHMRDGSWKERDFTRGGSLCRDKPDEDVTEIVFVGSNASPDRKVVSDDPQLILTEECELPRFRVLAASVDNLTKGSQSVSQFCGSVSGTETFRGTLGSAHDDPENTLRPGVDGGYEGQVFAPVPAQWDKQLEGCDFDRNPCATTRTDTPMPDGTWPIGFTIVVDPARPDVAKLRWSIERPSIGFFDADDSVCLVFEFWNVHDNATGRTEVPLEELMTGTHTYSATGSDVWSADALGHAADLSMTWSYSVTFQAVDANGQPL